MRRPGRGPAACGAMSPLRLERALALCVLLFGAPAPWLRGGVCPAIAQEEGAAPAEAAEAAAEAGAEGGDDEPAEGGQNFVDSAKELQDKLAQLKGLLAAKGGDVDPQLKERLEGLEKQLEGLDLGGGLGGGSGGEASAELLEFLGGCVMMSLRKAGMRKPQSLAALGALASGKLTQEEGSDLDLVRMVSVCISELTDKELAEFKAGQLQVLPQALAAKAADAGAKDVVLGIEAEVWKQLGPVSKALQSQILGDASGGRSLPSGVGLIAGVPLFLAFVFLGKKFLEMQARDGEKKDKKKSKAKDK